MKTCTKCKKEKNFTEFYKDKRKWDGLRCWCKSCQLEDNKKREFEYKQTRKDYRKTETYKQIKRDYYKKNKEKILAENKVWTQTFKGRLFSYMRNAEQRGVKWLLTEEDFKSFWKKSCSYCGDEIETIGIDRIDSAGDYELVNCKPCCSDCNRMKMELSEENFLKMIKKIHDNLKL